MENRSLLKYRIPPGKSKRMLEEDFDIVSIDKRNLKILKATNCTVLLEHGLVSIPADVNVK